MSRKTPAQIVMYCTSWCPDCHRARLFLDKKQIDYLEVDIEADEQAAHLVEQINHGYRSVPTIVFPDGSHLTEPSIAELADKTGQLKQAQ